MKKVVSYLILIGCLNGLMGQNVSLVGAWKFAGFDMKQELPPAKKNMLTRFFGKSFITLNEDKTFHAKITPKEERGNYSIKKDQLQLKTAGGDLVKFPFVYVNSDTFKLEMEVDEYIVYSRSKEIAETVPTETKELTFAPVNLDLLLDHTWAFQKMIKAREGKEPVIASGSFFANDFVSFKKGGIYEGIHLKTEEQGTWSLEDKGTKLVKTLADETTTFWYVVTVNEEELILNKGTGDHKWYYQKKTE